MMRQLLICGVLLAGMTFSASGEDKEIKVPAAPKNAG
ncbi:MAG: hypothetical protein JWN70_6020, partial [Planctomycetaceae bacterium]|nr:hypothetical protein [Planctomycetaceae bacterium]